MEQGQLGQPSKTGVQEKIQGTPGEGSKVWLKAAHERTKCINWEFF